MRTITTNKKITLVSHTSIRALLKRNGFNVGRWGDNGRISGLANFHGDVEVKEYELGLKLDSKKVADKLWKNIYTKTVGVQIFVDNGDVDINEIAKLLTDYEIKIENKSIIISDKK